MPPSVNAARPLLNRRLAPFTSTIFAEMSALATSTGAINLGQGFPDTDGPEEIREIAVEAIRSGLNQYPPGPGMPVLREAIAVHQHRFYGLAYDPDTEVLVTAGATEAVAATMLALLEPGDEVVALEPYYDSYAATIAMAGAVRTPVTLRAPDFRLDPERLRAAVTPRTRMMLINTPHNPTGAVLDRADLQAIADIAIEHDLIVVTDEVYEHLVFDDAVHVPIATLPGMRERTVLISSAGKTFSLTGWKIGWVCASAALVGAVKASKQFLTFVNGSPFQPAIAAGLRFPDEFFTAQTASLQSKRDRLLGGLRQVGLEAFTPSGTYFITTDVRSVGYDDGVEFCRDLPAKLGVVAIPAVVFYDDKSQGSSLVRFAFCKRDEVLDAAIERLDGLSTMRAKAS